MKVVIAVVMLMVGTVVGDAGIGCDNISDYYLEIGCSPGTTQKPMNGTKCPKAFTCPEIANRDAGKCYYRGVAYDVGAAIPQSEILEPCSRACVCRISAETGVSFECAQVDCVETFDSEKRSCVYTYDSINTCCMTNSVCGKDALASLKSCLHDGQLYKEGQRIEPSNRHKVCLCTSQWDGNLENPQNCQDVNCGVEIHYQSEVRQNCAPVYSSSDTNGRCPIGFQCPKDLIKVVKLNKPLEVTEKCIFGNDTLSVGDEVTVIDKCVTCYCRVPPTLVCVRPSECDN